MIGTAEPALRLPHQAGLAVVVKEALANGRRTGRNDDAACAPKWRRLEAIAETAGDRSQTPKAKSVAGGHG
ncbi:MAG TPA: hypothetical protein VG013_22035 [Gemmataceae bacterium]|jgi:hypothetical protein|nr:hypothetical protein [Gemmataceae bacterium]